MTNPSKELREQIEAQVDARFGGDAVGAARFIDLLDEWHTQQLNAAVAEARESEARLYQRELSYYKNLTEQLMMKEHLKTNPTPIVIQTATLKQQPAKRLPVHLDPSQGKATQFKPGQSGNPAGKPKGRKHLSTWIQELLHDEEFETLLPLKETK